MWKTCGRLVHFLWTKRQRNFFFGGPALKIIRALDVHALSSGASLDRGAPKHTIQRVPENIQRFASTLVTSAVHRFEQSIAGRPYLIEAVAVSKDRWRAYIVRVPGVPTALMPFYGTTPIEAADLLCAWLTRAHARAANAAGTV